MSSSMPCLLFDVSKQYVYKISGTCCVQGRMTEANLPQKANQEPLSSLGTVIACF